MIRSLSKPRWIIVDIPSQRLCSYGKIVFEKIEQMHLSRGVSSKLTYNRYLTKEDHFHCLYKLL